MSPPETIGRAADIVTWVPLGALAVSLATLVAMAITNRRLVTSTDQKTLEERLAAAEAEIVRCMADRADLRSQLFSTMTDLTALQRTKRAAAKK